MYSLRWGWDREFAESSEWDARGGEDNVRRGSQVAAAAAAQPLHDGVRAPAPHLVYIEITDFVWASDIWPNKGPTHSSIFENT